MSELAMTPVFVAITAANVGALNTAVATAVTTAKAVSGYVTNTVEIGNLQVDSSNQAVYTYIKYRVQVQS